MSLKRVNETSKVAENCRHTKMLRRCQTQAVHYSVSRAKEYTICIHIALLYMYIHVCVEQIHVRNCVCCISLVRIWNNYICFCNRRNARRLIQNDHLIMRLFSYPRDLVINKNINLLYVIYRLNKKHKSSNR